MKDNYKLQIEYKDIGKERIKTQVYDITTIKEGTTMSARWLYTQNEFTTIRILLVGFSQNARKYLLSKGADYLQFVNKKWEAKIYKKGD